MVQLHHLESEGRGERGILAKGCSSENRKQYSKQLSGKECAEEDERVKINKKKQKRERERFYSHESSSLTSQMERV